MLEILVTQDLKDLLDKENKKRLKKIKSDSIFIE